MPRWKALPEELDPQVREFVGQLRRVVDRSGLSVFAVADRTGYSKTSWERYLNGRLLAPKGAIVALAEVTDTDPGHLTTMWELAERSWSRSEMRHDMTMEAIRISRARAALGDPGAAPEPDRAVSGAVSAVPSKAGGRVGTAPRAPGASPDGPGRTAGAQGAYGPAPAGGPGGAGGSGGTRRRRRLTLFLTGLAGAAVVIAAVFQLTGGDHEKPGTAVPKPSPTAASPSPDLPPGVKCSGASCTGKDPEDMGCGGTRATTATSITLGTTLVEVRYSTTCGAAWARITRATLGDAVQVSTSGAARQTASVIEAGDTDAYTPMLAVAEASAAQACATLASRLTGCTR
ncbi:XRE family transcriptional regulator [Streptomyces sp. SID2888]|uniref:helix-turn-helix domain-containing protein n=1 Tax=Streptomyces sp. SID2888 TaxID=2690256 RepID=UPI00136BC4AF|nr:XRE family transcriptional regulator [Streptomyces sp. SID2888]MYV46098.1 DUF2690 domain-containing protein [Streptomyces sp. SID2888]